MSDEPLPRGFATRLSHTGRPGTHEYGFVNPPVRRGSTVLWPSMQRRLTGRTDPFAQVLTYGLEGSETTWALENLVADIEGGTRCQILCSGLAAVTVPLIAFMAAGEHCLVPDSVYGPTRSFCNTMLKRFGVGTTYYDPCIDPAGLDALFQPNTKVLFTESPGSHTFEVQDIPALAAVAHRRGAKVLMDNTWGVHFFQPFRHGVDVSIQALTKYVGGHSDIILGAATVATDGDWHRLRRGAMELGMSASPDDCWLALRGARTLGVRLDQHMKNGIAVAQWLAGRPEVLQVLHPALPGAPGHELWKRDFTGACSLFGVVFRPEFTEAAVHAFADALELFGIGASWGGFESLVLPTQHTIRRSAGTGQFGGQLCRLHVGLEDPADLIADLSHGLTALHSATG